MIETNDLQHLQNSINSLRDCETFNKDSVIDCLDEIFALLLKMNKMKIRSCDYSRHTWIVKEDEE